MIQQEILFQQECSSVLDELNCATTAPALDPKQKLRTNTGNKAVGFWLSPKIESRRKCVGSVSQWPKHVAQILGEGLMCPGLGSQYCNNWLH